MPNKKIKQSDQFTTLRKQIKGDFDKGIKEIKNDFSRQNNILYEKFSDDVKKVAELSLGINEKVDRMESKLDATFEMTGKLTMDVEIIKQDVNFIFSDRIPRL